MKTVNLKHLDFLSDLAPRRVSFPYSEDTVTEKICIIRPGGLGDLVVLTKALQILQISLHAFDWVVEKRNAAWLQFLGVSCVSYDALSGIRFFLKKFHKYQTIVVTEQYHGLAAVYATMLAKKHAPILGFSSNRRADLFSLPVDHTPQENHELQNFISLLSNLNFSKSTYLVPPNFAEVTSQHVVVALTGEYDASKQLSVLEWQQIIRYAGRYQLPVYLLGTKHFEPLADTLEQNIPGLHNYVGKISFPEVVALVRNANRFVGTESGLMHIADYYGVPSDVLINSENMVQWAPLTPHSNSMHAISDFKTPSMLPKDLSHHQQ